MKVIPVSCLSDNYAYIVIGATCSLIIDAVTPSNVIAKIPSTAPLAAILTTHHHYDHAGGNKALASVYPDLPIYGGDERIDAVTHLVQHRSAFSVNDDLHVQVIGTPCHTRGSVSYLIHQIGEEHDQAVFTGDTLFIGGCGRFFEGTAEEMLHSLKRLAKLDKHTRVYCGHEYTVANLKFATSIEPDNLNALTKLRWASSVDCTIPSTIEEELLFNPFMRVDLEPLKVATGENDPVKVMDKLRTMKNNF